MSLDQPQDVSSPRVGEPSYGVVRSTATKHCRLRRQIVLLVSIKTKDVVIKFRYINKVIVVSLIEPILSDALKAYMSSLGIRKNSILGVYLFMW